MNSLDQKTGIYGIYIENELVYVGSTTRGFGVRFFEHRDRMLNENYKGQPLLYNTLRNAKKMGKHIRLEPLIVVEDLYKKGRCITKHDVQAMELAFITYFKPRLNTEGIKTKYILNY